MLSGALRIGAVRGIDIKIHASWVIIALLVGWTFWARFSDAHGHDVTGALVMALVATVLFFLSVLAHELAHSLEAQHRGVTVSGITLFLFGGVTETRFDVRRPRDEFALTAVGPFTSFVLAAAFGIVATYANFYGLSTVGVVTGELGWINLALGIFNLLPGAPLDGGRILRSGVWWVTGDRDRAVRVAGRSGQALGAVLTAFGLFQAFFVPRGELGGVWLAFIGWFLFTAASQELTQQEARSLLEGRTVSDLSGSLPPVLEAEASAAEAADLLTSTPWDVVLARRNGSLGVIELDDLAGVPHARRATTRAADVASPVEELPQVPEHKEIADVLEELSGTSIIAVVDDEGRLVGIATERQLVRALERAARLNRPARSSPGRGRRSRRAHLPGEHRP